MVEFLDERQCDSPRGESVGWRSVIDEYSERAETILASSLDIIAVYTLRLFAFPAFALLMLVLVLRNALRLPEDRTTG